MSRFRYNSEIPADMLNIFQSELDALDWLLPRWCQGCDVYFVDAPERVGMGRNAAADATTFDAYREARIRISAKWLTEPKEVRRDMLIHEIMHIPVGVLFNFASNEIEDLLPQEEDDKHRKTVLRELNTRWEQTVCDLADTISEYLKKQ